MAFAIRDFLLWSVDSRIHPGRFVPQAQYARAGRSGGAGMTAPLSSTQHNLLRLHSPECHPGFSFCLILPSSPPSAVPPPSKREAQDHMLSFKKATVLRLPLRGSCQPQTEGVILGLSIYGISSVFPFPLLLQRGRNRTLVPISEPILPYLSGSRNATNKLFSKNFCGEVRFHGLSRIFILSNLLFSQVVPPSLHANI